MAQDISGLTYAERILLAQFLAMKAGGVGNAPALTQMVLDRLASGKYGSTLYEVVAGLLPEGIPYGIDYSPYIPFVSGRPPAPPAPVAPAVPVSQSSSSSSSSSQTSPGDQFGPRPSGVMDPETGKKLVGETAYNIFDWLDGGTGGKIDIGQMFGQPPAAPPTPKMRDVGGGIAVGPAPGGPLPDLNPTAGDVPLAAPAPLDLTLPVSMPRRDPRGYAVAPAPAPVAPVPATAGLPELPLANQPAGSTTAKQATERLAATGKPFIDPTAPANASQYLGTQPPVGMDFGTLVQEAAPMPVRSVKTVPVNPTTGSAVDFPALRSAALQRDVAGPFNYETADRAIGTMSALAPVPNNIVEPAPATVPFPWPDLPAANPGAFRALVELSMRGAAAPAPVEPQPAAAAHPFGQFPDGSAFDRYVQSGQQAADAEAMKSRPAVLPWDGVIKPSMRAPEDMKPGEERTVSRIREEEQLFDYPGFPGRVELDTQGRPQSANIEDRRPVGGANFQPGVRADLSTALDLGARPAVTAQPFNWPDLPAAPDATARGVEDLAARMRGAGATAAPNVPELRPPVAAGTPMSSARVAVNRISQEGAIDLSDSDREMLARAVATEVDPALARVNPAEYQQQVYRVVDVMLNRVASGQFADGTVSGVLNQPNQFSMINGPRRAGKEVYGSVESIPADKASADLRATIEDWIGKRGDGTPSSVEGALHYANPKVADASNMRWINKLDTVREDAGPFSHWYGTTEGFTPKEAVIAPTQRSISSADWFAPAPITKPAAAPISNALTPGARAVSQAASTALNETFNNALRTAAVQAQKVTAPTGGTITVAQRNAISGGGSQSSVGDAFTTNPGQKVSTPTGGTVTAAQRNAIASYTTPAPTPAKSTSPSQKVTSSSGGSITVAQRNAFGGY